MKSYRGNPVNRNEGASNSWAFHPRLHGFVLEINPTLGWPIAEAQTRVGLGTHTGRLGSGRERRFLGFPAASFQVFIELAD